MLAPMSLAARDLFVIVWLCVVYYVANVNAAGWTSSVIKKFLNLRDAKISAAPGDRLNQLEIALGQTNNVSSCNLVLSYMHIYIYICIYKRACF